MLQLQPRGSYCAHRLTTASLLQISFVPGVEWHEVIKSCWLPDPKDRPTAAQLLRSVESLAEGARAASDLSTDISSSDESGDDDDDVSTTWSYGSDTTCGASSDITVWNDEDGLRLAKQQRRR